MHGRTALIGLGRFLAVGLVFGASRISPFGAEVAIIRTNWFDRCITNLIEVRMPANRFVNEYHTNWVTQLRTNVIDVYATNQVAVDVLRTNFVARYQTNWSTVSLTNWETVILFKTNWITQPVTNVVQVALPTPPTAAEPVSRKFEPKEAQTATGVSAPAAAWVGPLALETVPTALPSTNNLVEVQLKVRWTGNTAAPLQVQNWRVERDDGAILIFGQDQEFKRQLPVGNYKVEARLKGEGNNPPLAARGTLSVTPHEATIQPKLVGKK